MPSCSSTAHHIQHMPVISRSRATSYSKTSLSPKTQCIHPSPALQQPIPPPRPSWLLAPCPPRSSPCSSPIYASSLQTTPASRFPVDSRMLSMRLSLRFDDVSSHRGKMSLQIWRRRRRRRVLRGGCCVAERCREVKRGRILGREVL